MPTAPNVLNYGIGGARIYLGGLNLGNVVNLEVEAQAEVLEHVTHYSGVGRVDLQTVTAKRLFFRARVDEHNGDLYRKYFMAGNTGLLVDALTLPLARTNLVVEWRNETGVIWSFSHTACTVRPAEAMDFSEFEQYVGYGLEIEVLEDILATPPVGRFTFTA